MSIVEAIVLGLVQGLTEFIPISSSAHLRIVPALLGWEDAGAAATAVIQLGTLLAVIVYFFRDLVAVARGCVKLVTGRRTDADARLALYLIVGSLPVVFFGLVFKDFIETGARNLWVVTSTLIGIAILLIAAERYAARRKGRGEDEVTMGDAVAIGFGQALALVPGSSRSGSTIMVGLFRGLSHSAAARFSFLLSVPAIFGSGLFEFVAEREHLAGLGWMPILVATVVSFITGWASIYFLIWYLRTHTTAIFIYYRIALGIVMAVLLATGYLTPME